jgi:hypothetical protein
MELQCMLVFQSIPLKSTYYGIFPYRRNYRYTSIDATLPLAQAESRRAYARRERYRQLGALFESLHYGIFLVYAGRIQSRFSSIIDGVYINTRLIQEEALEDSITK